MQNYLSDYFCVYKKDYNAQKALLALIEKWKSSIYKSGYARAVLMDLSEAFDCLNHDLLIAYLHACGFTKESHVLIRNCLKSKWQRTKIN